MCREFCVARVRSVTFLALRAVETCQGTSKGPSCSCANMCEHVRTALTRQGKVSANESRLAVHVFPASWCFLFFTYSCSCATCVRIRLFSVSRQGLSLRDMEEEIARDKQTFVTYHFDVRICCVWFMFQVAKVRCVIRAQKQCVKEHFFGPVCL